MNKIILSLFICIIIISCKKQPAKPAEPAIKIEGFKLLDYGGFDMGYYGTVDNDWKFVDTLSSAEMKLFDFPTAIALDNTVATEPYSDFACYPQSFLSFSIAKFKSSGFSFAESSSYRRKLKGIEQVCFQNKREF